jgi:hypothetical protein
LAVVEELKLPNVAEEAGVSVQTVKSVIKSHARGDGDWNMIDRLKNTWDKERRYQYLIKCLLDKSDPQITVAEIRSVLRS